MGASSVISSPSSHTLLPVMVPFGGSNYTCSALMDSGAGGNFLDSGMAERWGIPATPLPSPISVRSLDDSPITIITHVTPPVSLVVSGNHREITELYLLSSQSVPVVLGHPWLVQHGPHVDWARNSVLSWNLLSCLASCMCAAPSPGSVFPVL